MTITVHVSHSSNGTLLTLFLLPAMACGDDEHQ